MRRFPPLNLELLALEAQDRRTARDLAERNHAAFVALAARCLVEIDTTPAPEVLAESA